MPHARLMLIENSIGLSGSTISLCTLVRHLDRDRYAPVVVFSRPEQHAYFTARDDMNTPCTVIRCRPSLKSRAFVSGLLARCQRLGRQAERAAAMIVSALDLALVIGPYVARLYRFARAHDVTLIHQNNGFDVAAVLVATLLRVPLVAYQRGDEWNTALVRYLAQFVTRYIANSKATEHNLRSLGVPASRLEVVYPPVDLDIFDCRRPRRASRRSLGIPECARCVGIVGTLLEWKGHRVFLRAMQHVVSALPETHALIIGHVPDGDRRYQDELVAFARELGLTDRVAFTGFRADLPDLLQELDVVVHASITPEPFGRVIAEAMAMRRPVVATRAGGPLEIIEDRQNGRLVAAGDPVELATAIVELLSDRSLADRLSEQAHLTASRRFSATTHAADVQAVYDRSTGLRLAQRSTDKRKAARVS